MHCAQCGTQHQLGESQCRHCGAPRLKITEKHRQTEINFLRLKKLFQSRKLSEADFNAALQALVFQDAQGVYWMIGAESELWFRHSAGEWIPADPPLEPVAPSQPPGHAQPEIQATPVSPAQPARRPPAPAAPAELSRQPPRRGIPRSCWWIGGLSTLLLAVCCMLGIALRQPILNFLVPYAVELGWAQVIEEAPLSNDILPTGLPTASQAVRKEPGWPRYSCPAAGVTLAAPENFTHDPIGQEYFILRDELQYWMMDVQCYQAEHGGDFDQELAWWLAFQDNPAWGEIHSESTEVGPLGWTQGPNSDGNPIFTAAIGPTQDGRMIYLWGQAPESDWDNALGLFLRIARSISYQE